MRRFTALAAFLMVLGAASLGIAGEGDKCAMCHKGDKALDKIAAAKNIKSTSDLKKTMKEGPSAQMHAKFTEDDINSAAKSLKLAE